MIRYKKNEYTIYLVSKMEKVYALALRQIYDRMKEKLKRNDCIVEVALRYLLPWKQDKDLHTKKPCEGCYPKVDMLKKTKC